MNLLKNSTKNNKTETLTIIKNQLVKSLLFVLGVTAVALGIIGAFVPILPTTPFLLLAAWCFLNSSEKAHRWLYNQPFLGKALKDWDTYRSISRPTKVTAISMILISLIFIWLKVENIWIQTIVTLILTCVSLFITTRNEPRV